VVTKVSDAESFTDRVERIATDQHISVSAAARIARAEVRIENSKEIETSPLGELTSALTALQSYVGAVNRAHGFRDYTDLLLEQMHTSEAKGLSDSALRETLTRLQGNALMLIVGEVAEAHEELRKGRRADETYYPEAHPFGVGPTARPNKPEGVPSEIADIVIRCLDFADAYGFDLGSMIAEKVAYNETRPYKHGKKF